MINKAIWLFFQTKVTEIAIETSIKEIMYEIDKTQNKKAKIVARNQLPLFL